MQNFIFVCVGTVMIGAMIATSNMAMREKVTTVLAIIGISIIAGFQFTPDAFWLVPCVIVGTCMGRFVNHSIDRRRFKTMKKIMSENKTSL